MKKTAIIAGICFLLFTASVSAQVDTTASSQAIVKTRVDQWNNHSPEEYKLLPMPEPLTTEKIFPVIGKYSVTDKDGAASDVTIALDPDNKGIAWVEGLPQGRMKAYLRKSPGTYMIPVQKTESNKDVPGGVLIYDKDANTMNVCLGCKYNSEDPTVAFTEVAQETTVVYVKNKKGKKVAKTKVKPIKTWKYSGSKVVGETTASVVPMQ
jgi:hypothetical protein